MPEDYSSLSWFSPLSLIYLCCYKLLRCSGGREMGGALSSPTGSHSGLPDDLGSDGGYHSDKSAKAYVCKKKVKTKKYKTRHQQPQSTATMEGEATAVWFQVTQTCLDCLGKCAQRPGGGFKGQRNRVLVYVLCQTATAHCVHIYLQCALLCSQKSWKRRHTQQL